MCEQNNVFFSIVIPVYNTVNELPRCISSIVSQSFTQYEIILVDDGSTDGSSKLCDDFSEKYNVIRVIHKENGGCSDARNRGVKEAQGDYLLFVDSDDAWLDNNALSDIYKLLQKAPDTEVVLFGVSIYDSNGRLVKKRIPEHVMGDKKVVLGELIKKNQYLSTSYVKVLNRKFFLKNKLFFVSGLLSEDIEWSARIMMYCNTLLIYSNAFYKRVYRDSGSITSNIGKKNIVDILNQIENGVALIEKNINNEKLKNIYLEYWAYQYAILMGHFRKIANDKEYKMLLAKLKRYVWLLSYNNVKKVKLVYWAVKLFGMNVTLRILERYMKRKH